jgi:hypothetical protein
MTTTFLTEMASLAAVVNGASSGGLPFVEAGGASGGPGGGEAGVTATTSGISTATAGTSTASGVNGAGTSFISVEVGISTTAAEPS